MERLYKDAESFDKNTLTSIVYLLESVRNKVESMYHYMDGEAEFDLHTLDDYRIDCGDIGDEVFELKGLFNKILHPHREEISVSLNKDIMAEWMKKEATDPDMDGRC